MFELINVSKRYGNKHALQPTTLQLNAGTTYAIVGPSGCGKSTLLRLMIGLIVPETGTIRFENALLSRQNINTLRHKIGYVIQEGGLFPHLTAKQNVSLMANYLGWKRQRVGQRIDELTDLTHFPVDGLHRYPAQLSGGQRQRVSLMRALMLDPDVLLLDEPLGALDPMIRSELQRELQQIFQLLGKTVVLVTHDLYEARFFGDVIVLLRDGRIIQQGTFQQLSTSPADPFVTSFINAQRPVESSP